MSPNSTRNQQAPYSLVLASAIIILKPAMSLSTRQALLLPLLLAISGAMPGLLRAQSTLTSPEVTQFQHVEDNWSIAFVKKDQYAMELLLAPSFVNISASGDVSTRNQLIAQMFDHSAGDLHSIEQRAVNVRVLGDTAIVQGTYLIQYRASSHTVDERGVFTHVYQRARASWLCVNAQRTAVFDQADAKQKQTGKKSTAALPFHIPLVYKGAEAIQSPPTSDKQSPQ